MTSCGETPWNPWTPDTAAWYARKVRASVLAELRRRLYQISGPTVESLITELAREEPPCVVWYEPDTFRPDDAWPSGLWRYDEAALLARLSSSRVEAADAEARAMQEASHYPTLGTWLAAAVRGELTESGPHETFAFLVLHGAERRQYETGFRRAATRLRRACRGCGVEFRPTRRNMVRCSGCRRQRTMLADRFGEG